MTTEQERHIPDVFNVEQVKRAVAILRAQGITTRTQLLERFDAHASYIALKHIGPARNTLLRKLVKVPDDLWTTLTGMEV